MAIRSADYDEPLLLTETYIEGMVNYKGEKIKNNNSEFGGWRSASRVIVTGGIESFIIFGVSANLISYLTTQLGQSTATAAQNINAWSGITHMLPVLIAYVGDSYLGRFRTILFSTVIYILGLGLLTFCTSQLVTCSDIAAEDNLSCPSPSTFEVIFFFFSLYLIGFGSAGYKTCVPAFGADQIGELNSQESKSNGSFFNWWVLGQSVGSCSSHLILHYVQDNLGWGLAFGISCISMVIALVVIMSGIKLYRYTLKKDADKVNPYKGITDGLVNTVQNWRTTSSSLAITIQVDPTTSKLQGSRKAVTAFTISKDEGVKAVLRVVPVWIICLAYPIVQSQVTTFFIKQASTMDRSIGPDFQIPTASVQIFLSISIILFAAMYGRTFVPIAQAFTGKTYGITKLQRIGGGIFISAMSMVVAGIVENRRLRIAQEFGLVDDPKATVPLVVWWLIPQYVLSGLGLVFAAIGLQEFFYDQVPNGLRSVGLSLYWTMFGIGHFLSVLLISVIQKVTTAGGEHGWIANNINQAHLDYFYWFLAGLSVIELVAFLCFSKSYVYKQGSPL